MFPCDFIVVQSSMGDGASLLLLFIENILAQYVFGMNHNSISHT